MATVKKDDDDKKFDKQQVTTTKPEKHADPSNANAEANNEDLKSRLDTHEKTVVKTQKNADPDNEKKQVENIKKSNSWVDPTSDKLAAHKNKKVDGPPNNAVIKGINGCEVTLCDSNCKDADDTDSDCCVWIAKKADITLNGETVTLAALDNGDKVQLGNGGKTKDGVFEYKKVTATRDAKE